MTRRCRCFCAASILSTLFITVPGCGRINQSEGDAQPSAASAQKTAPKAGETQLADGGAKSATGATQAISSQEPADPFQASLQALKPFNALIGAWQGVTVRAIGGAKAIENPQWNWDFLTDREQPALVVTSKSSPYVRLARLTYQPARHIYQLLLTSPSGSQKVFEGKLAEQFEQSSQQLVLSLLKVSREGDPETISFRLKGTDRYDLEVSRMMTAETNEPEQTGGLVQAGGFGGQVINSSQAVQQASGQSTKTLQHYDTVQMKREAAGNATSADSQPCIVSGGRGATSLTFEGKTYFVCCEGCKAAFMADPLRWTTAASSHPNR